MHYIILAVAIIASGCVEGPLSPSAPSSSHPSSATPSSPTVLPELVPSRSDLHMDDCHGFLAAEFWTGTSPPEPTPQNWSRAGNGFPPSAYYEYWACARIKFGDLERPAALLIETHDYVAPPRKCAANGSGVHPAILRTLWVNDTEMRDALAGAGWPVRKFTAATIASDMQTTTSFQVDGQKAGALSFALGPLPAQTLADKVIYFWQDGAGIGRADFEFSHKTSLESSISWGELGAPFLWADTGSATFAGRGQSVISGTGTMHYQHFEDSLCTTSP